jgi:hypothetical protein
VAEYLKLRRELGQAEGDIEDGIADESLARAIKQDIAQLRQVANVKEYMDALDKLKALRLVKPFQGDNTGIRWIAIYECLIAWGPWMSLTDNDFDADESVSS